MKETVKNEILGEILENAVPTTDVQVVVERLNKKEEVVEIAVIRKDGTKNIITTQVTKNGFMWAATLIMTLAKIPKVRTTILVTDTI